MSIDLFTTWKSGVLAGIQAPDDPTNTDTLWAWQAAEGGIGHNNPLNTTEELLAGIDVDPDFNRVGVEIYPTIQDGVVATVATLLNGRYPTIVSHLRNSVPRAQWRDACGDLGTWGTGCGWITETFAAYGGQLTGDDFMSALSDASQLEIYNDIKAIAAAVPVDLSSDIDAIAHAVPADLISRLDGIEAALSEIKQHLGLAAPGTAPAAQEPVPGDGGGGPAHAC